MSLDRDKERRDLAKIEASIIEGERRISEQRLRVDELRRNGRETAEAETTLRSFEDSLVEWRHHRDSIIALIAQIDAGLV